MKMMANDLISLGIKVNGIGKKKYLREENSGNENLNHLKNFIRINSFDNKDLHEVSDCLSNKIKI